MKDSGHDFNEVLTRRPCPADSIKTMRGHGSRPEPDVFHIIDEATRKPAANPVALCLEEGSVVSLANSVVLISRHGNEYAIEDSAAPIRHTDGRIVGAVLVFKDATEKKRLVSQISHQAR